jgi:AbiJ N-terminal domain 4
MGLTRPPELAIQEVSSQLRVAIWNAFQPPLFSARGTHGWRAQLVPVYEYLHWPTHKMSWSEPHDTTRLEQWYFGELDEWYEFYNFVEFVTGLLAGMASSQSNIYTQFNQVLQDEGSPYRFVNKVLTPITDPIEIQAVRDAVSVTDRFAGAREHLTKALELLGNRPEPDFRNTIKEAISAVESTLKVITGHEHADLAEALREFAKTHPIHGALFKGLDSLYGYTSNEHGLRHALLEADAKVGFAEAKFVVVACSAFVSYLIARAAQ